MTDREQTRHEGERVVVVGGDTEDPTGTVIGQRWAPIPGNPLHGMNEEQVNVRLDGGGETGFIPVTLVMPVDERPVTEQTHDPVQGLPRPRFSKGQMAMVHGSDGSRVGKVFDARVVPSGEATGGYVDEVNVNFSDGSFSGWMSSEFVEHTDLGPGWVAEVDKEQQRVASRPEDRPYIDPAPKTPETLAGVVGELEDVAEWVKHGTLGSIKMRELRQKVIKAAITVKGCASTWEFEREHRPGMREAPMPGSHSSKMLNVRKELESIAFAIDSYLQAKTDKSEKGNILERLKQVVVMTNSLQHTWLADEYAMGSQARDLAAFDAERKEPSKHMLLFFGPSVADDRTTKEMKRTGTLPESKMDDRINQLMREGWRVVFRHYDPSFHVEQWRVILEKS